MRRGAFLLSLPERCLRALASLLGGGLLISLETILPGALKRTTLYRILIGDGLRFLVERIAGMPSPELPALPRDYHHRKLAGSAIEGVGLLAVQFSPLWVFAIAGDAAAGGQVFLRRLVDHLKWQGVIDEKEPIEDLTSLLDALQDASRATAGMIDTPPLTRTELEQMAGELKVAYGNLFQGSKDLLPRFERLWREMKEISESPALSLSALSRFMSLEVRTWVNRSGGFVKAMGMTGSELFGEHILAGYQRTLEELKSAGPWTFFRVRFLPYWLAAGSQFQPGNPSWIEQQLIGNRVSL